MASLDSGIRYSQGSEYLDIYVFIKGQHVPDTVLVAVKDIKETVSALGEAMLW